MEKELSCGKIQLIRGGADVGYSLVQIDDNGFIIAGTSMTPFGYYTIRSLIIRTDTNGNVIWDRNFGSRIFEGLYSVDITSDSCIIATGYTESYGAGKKDICLIAMDSEGEVKSLPLVSTQINTDDTIGEYVNRGNDSEYLRVKEDGTWFIQEHDPHLQVRGL